MKKIIFLTFVISTLITGCTHVRTLSSGIENEAFLEFIYTNQKYQDGVDVTIDDKAPYNAVVNKDKAKSSRGNIYTISTGSHTISVSYKGQIIYKKQVFLSSQQTLKIKLQ
jgi:hypothetical protein